MRFMKKKGYENTTLRWVRSDDRAVFFGVVGTVRDLLDVGLLEWCDYSPDLWLFLPAKNIYAGRYGKTREEAVSELEGGKK